MDLGIRTLSVDVNNLVVGQRYIVTYRTRDNNVVTFTGTFSSSRPGGNIVFANVANGTGGHQAVSFPMQWFISANVAVSNLPGPMNQHVNSYLGGRRNRTKRKSRRSRSRR